MTTEDVTSTKAPRTTGAARPLTAEQIAIARNAEGLWVHLWRPSGLADRWVTPGRAAAARDK